MHPPEIVDANARVMAELCVFKPMNRRAELPSCVAFAGATTAQAFFRSAWPISSLSFANYPGIIRV